MPSNDRYGFTLLELMIAITLGAGLLLGGRLLLEQVANTSHVIALQSAITDSSRVRDRTLRNLFRNVEVGTGDSVTFGGTDHAMRFWSWCDSAAGLRRRCVVSVTLDTSLTVRQSTNSGSVVLMRRAAPGTFRYLGDAHGGGKWYRSWGPTVTAPLAVEIIFGDDTTTLRIGERG